MRRGFALLAICGGVLVSLGMACGGSAGTSGPTASTDATALPSASPSPSSTATVGSSGFALSSAAFADGQTIPTDFTCDGRGVSPPLAWTGVPTGTKALALIVDDPDAANGGFVHWVIYAIPPELGSFQAGISPKPGVIPAGPIEGVNGSGKVGYTPPCPPSGQTHHYNFHLYAVDIPLPLAPGRSKADVETAISGHTLAQATLIGLYKRQ